GLRSLAGEYESESTHWRQSLRAHWLGPRAARAFLHVSLQPTYPGCVAAEDVPSPPDPPLSPRVAAAGDRLQNPRELSDRVAMGRALWRELVVGFASQLGQLRLGFTQLAALYVLADTGTTTIA